MAVVLEVSANAANAGRVLADTAKKTEAVGLAAEKANDREARSINRTTAALKAQQKATAEATRSQRELAEALSKFGGVGGAALGQMGKRMAVLGVSALLAGKAAQSSLLIFDSWRSHVHAMAEDAHRLATSIEQAKRAGEDAADQRSMGTAKGFGALLPVIAASKDGQSILANMSERTGLSQESLAPTLAKALRKNSSAVVSEGAAALAPLINAGLLTPEALETPALKSIVTRNAGDPRAIQRALIRSSGQAVPKDLDAQLDRMRFSPEYRTLNALRMDERIGGDALKQEAIARAPRASGQALNRTLLEIARPGANAIREIARNAEDEADLADVRARARTMGDDALSPIEGYKVYSERIRTTKVADAAEQAYMKMTEALRENTNEMRRKNPYTGEPANARR